MTYDFSKTQQFNDKFGTYNEGLGVCPIMSKQGAACYCTKDCALIGDKFHCQLKLRLTRREKRKLERLTRQIEEAPV